MVGHRDRAEPLGLRVVEQRGRLDRAVVRVVRVHVQVGDDPFPVGKRLGLVRPGRAAAARGGGVQPFELRRHVGEARTGDIRAACRSVALPRIAVLGEAEERGGGQLRLREDARRLDERAARGGRLLAEPAQALGRGNDDRGRAKQFRTRGRRDAGADVDAVAEPDRYRRPRREPRRAEQHRLPAGHRAKRAQRRADDGQPCRGGLDHDEVALPAGSEEIEVDPRRDDRERPGKSLRRTCGDLVGGRKQRVDPCEEPVAVVAPRREAEPLRVDERRSRRRLGLEERDVREPRHRRVEAVHHVEVAAPESGRDVRAHPDGDPDRGARRDGHGSRQGDDVLQPALLQRAPTRDEVGRSRRRSQDHDVVTPPAESRGDARDVFVRVVRHRPRMRGHQADPERHGFRL